MLNTLNLLSDTSYDLSAGHKGIATRYLATANFSTLAEEALQLHGSIGMASEHPCHLFLKRALLNSHLGRSGDRYEQHIADELLIAR